MDDLIHNLSPDDDKFQELAIARSCFEDNFDEKPAFYVRVPGRVNLIGEHIDYCGYAVFPMAIEQDIILAVGLTSDQKLNLTNLNSLHYENNSSDIETLKIDQSDPKWYHYFFCGVKGITDEKSIISVCGMDIAVHGTIPPSAGLSSSSALVCSAALATAYANKIVTNRLELASLCAKSEHLIGTEGGGMDQAIAFLAEPGTAKLIEFNPLKATNVSLPAGATFVIANSCVEMNKAASQHYNIRVVECRLAAQIIAKTKGLDWKKLRILGDVQKALNCEVHDMASIVEEIFHKEPFTREEICVTLGLTDEELISESLSENTKDLTTFQLCQRALHVYEEASRVLKFKDVCEQGSPTALEELGSLMNASHASCRDLYECSHPELDELVSLSVKSGALGSRLTGAGWGGCCVSLVPSAHLDSFMAKLKSDFYTVTQRRKQMVSTSLFPTLPGGGAVIYVVA